MLIRRVFIFKLLLIYLFFIHIYLVLTLLLSVFTGTRSCFTLKLFEQGSNNILIHYRILLTIGKSRLLLILFYFITCVYCIFVLFVHYFIFLLNLKKWIQSGPTVVDFEGCLTPFLRNNLNPLPRILIS